MGLLSRSIYVQSFRRSQWRGAFASHRGNEPAPHEGYPAIEIIEKVQWHDCRSDERPALLEEEAEEPPVRDDRDSQQQRAGHERSRLEHRSEEHTSELQ